MYIDRQNLFGQSQAVTVTAPSTDYIDLGSVRDVGNGTPLEILVLCTETVTAAGAATVTVALQSDDNASFSSPTNLVLSDAVPKASLIAGAEVLRVAVRRGALPTPQLHRGHRSADGRQAHVRPGADAAGEHGLRVGLRGVTGVASWRDFK